MAERKVTQKQIAEATGISPAAVNNYLQNRIPKAGELFRLAGFFKVSMESFLTSMPPEMPSEKEMNRMAFGEIPANHAHTFAQSLGLSLSELYAAVEYWKESRSRFAETHLPGQGVPAATLENIIKVDYKKRRKK